MTERLKVAVIGEGHLADATRVGCRHHFDNVDSLDHANLVWFCSNTPVDEYDVPDVAAVHDGLAKFIPHIPPTVPILISSQLPVGTTRMWEMEWPEYHLYYQPENIRIATAVDDFLYQDRMIVGLSRHNVNKDGARLDVIDTVLGKFTEQILYMSQESAEMAKHALNCWLAMNIAYANEIADICKLVGANVSDVFEGFRSDGRVSGPLDPRGPYTGGTLGRDVQVLFDLVDGDMWLIAGIHKSNDDQLEGRFK